MVDVCVSRAGRLSVNCHCHGQTQTIQLMNTASGRMEMSTQEKCRWLLTSSKELKFDGDISKLQGDILKEMILSYDSELFAEPSKSTARERVTTYTREMYDALFEGLSLEKAHIIATTYAEELSEADTRALVYGEVDFDSFAEVLRAATIGIKRCYTFVDLGHGTGRAVFVAALLCNFRRYFGIEILRGLYDTSTNILQKFKRSVAPLLSRDAPTIDFAHGSFLSRVHDWSNADLVFANSTCFPDELIADIEVECRRLKEGSRVITFTTSLRSEFFKIIFKKRLSMSWGPATVYIHERLPDVEVQQGVCDRFDRLAATVTTATHVLNLPDTIADDVESTDAISVDSNGLSTRVLPPVHTDDSSSLATTTGNTVESNFSITSEWDPDTPTLRAWARHELRKSANALGGNGDGDYFDHMMGTSAGTCSLSSSEPCEEDGDEADDENTDDCDDYAAEDLDFSRLNISGTAFKSSGNGVIYQDNDADEDDYDYDDDMDVVVDNRVERYFHVADDSDENEDEDDVVDDVYDDSS